MLTALNTAAELKKNRPRMAILPVGATEQHGAHLPLANDTLFAEAVARRVAQELRAYCLPALPFSISHMNRGAAGTVWLRNQTLMAVIRDIAHSLRLEGFRQFVILNGHGGNRILLPIIQDLNLDFPDLVSISLNVWEPAFQAPIFPDLPPLQHGEEAETSCTLHLHPELVRRNKIRDEKKKFESYMLLFEPMTRLSRLAHTGCPSRATAEKGRRAIDCMVSHAVANIRNILRQVASVRKSCSKK